VKRPATRTAAASNAVVLVAYAEARGMRRDEILARFGLDPAALDDVDGRVPLAALARMWSELPALLDDEDMPLHVIAQAAAIDPPLTVLVFLASETLGAALRRLERYQRVTLDVADENVSELVIEDEVAHIVLHHERSASPPPTGAVIDALIGVLTLARMATKQHIVPLAITLRHPTPSRPDAYRAAFGCPVTFGAPRDRMTLARADLALSHPDASRTLLGIVERHAESALAQLPQGSELIREVREAIRAGLPDGRVTLRHLASPLGMSARTLQRRLEAEGTSHRRLLDEERRALALHHISDPRVSLVDLAFRLGFADQSAFSRAFARWTARSPTEYRRAGR